MISPPSTVIYRAPGPAHMCDTDFSSVVRKKNNAAINTGIVIGISLVIIVAIVSFCLWRRNKSEQIEQSSNYTDLCLEDISKSDQTYSSLETDRKCGQHRPVSFHMFCDHVMDLMMNNRQQLLQEYQDLQDSMESPSPATSKKNSSNGTAYNFSRVKLPNGKGDINKACFPLNQYFILIQHPELKRIDKFWQMVWEQKVSTITVLTGQMYTNKQWYFPEKDGTVCSIGNIKVQVHSTFRASETLVMRKIKLSRGRHSQTVNHFHVNNLDFEKLPDQILALLNLVSQNKISMGPQVIHGGCSGIDYNYVYIAVSYLINLILAGRNEVDVYGTFYTMIKETDFSTNSVEHYAAIYLSLKNYIQNSTASRKDGENIYEVLP